MGFSGDLDSLILGVLQFGELHGYEISRRIGQMSAMALQIRDGKLYPALHRLERDGFLQATWVPQEGKPPRKVYALTEAGMNELAGRRSQWKAFSEGVNAVLGAGGAVLEGSNGV